MRKILSLALLCGVALGAYDFSDEDFAINLLEKADWNCVSDMTQKGAGVFQFDGRGLSVVLKYGTDSLWTSTDAYVDNLLARADSLMDSLFVTGRDTMTLWGGTASVVNYRGFAWDGQRAGRIVALMGNRKLVAVIFVKLGTLEFTAKDETAIAEFLPGIEVDMKGPGGEGK